MDELLQTCLIESGLKAKEATMLCWFFDNQKGNGRDIERETGLRQPDVSITTNTLRLKGWLKYKEQKKTGKGRPIKNYSLAVPREKILSDLITDVREKADAKLVTINALEKLK